MTNGSLLQRQHVLAAAFVILLSCCIVDARPKVTVAAAPDLERYQKVYLGQIKNDHAKVYLGVLKRLQKAGFEVVELKPEKLPFVSQGTGFLVTSDGQVVTCAHVVGREPKATLWIQGVRYLGRVVAVDTNVDVAVIQVEDSHPPFRWVAFSAESTYRMGQDIFSMGFPLADLLGTQPRLTKGLVSSTSGLADDPKQLQVSAEVQAGNSGGPLLNARGEVIGMVSATLNPVKVMLLSGGDLPQNVNFAIKKEPIEEFLASSKVSFAARTNTPSADVFEDAGKSLVLVRGGIVDEERLHEKPLVCRCDYFLLNGNFLRLRISFIDVRKLSIVLSASLDQYTVASQNSVLDQMFAEICARFFPERPESKKKK
ncbi:MAG TPA: serine protease [Candidatus Acidoferrum sp.]|jgi:serine protease Do|nr:serine protease [Candidatus Acidoferrum sp.]